MFTALTHSAYVDIGDIAVDRVPNGFNWLIVFVVSFWLNRSKSVVLGNTRIEIKWL
jgi:hypothetical protein